LVIGYWGLFGVGEALASLFKARGRKIKMSILNPPQPPFAKGGRRGDYLEKEQ